jgi:hypothetical protein
MAVVRYSVPKTLASTALSFTPGLRSSQICSASAWIFRLGSALMSFGDGRACTGQPPVSRVTSTASATGGFVAGAVGAASVVAGAVGADVAPADGPVVGWGADVLAAAALVAAGVAELPPHAAKTAPLVTAALPAASARRKVRRVIPRSAVLG